MSSPSNILTLSTDCCRRPVAQRICCLNDAHPNNPASHLSAKRGEACELKKQLSSFSRILPVPSLRTSLYLPSALSETSIGTSFRRAARCTGDGVLRIHFYLTLLAACVLAAVAMSDHEDCNVMPDTLNNGPLLITSQGQAMQMKLLRYLSYKQERKLLRLSPHFTLTTPTLSLAMKSGYLAIRI